MPVPYSHVDPGHATKPGDVVRAMNGKSIEVIDTDAEGRMILASCFFHLQNFLKLPAYLRSSI